MHKYHFVAKGVAPKREALRIAEEELAVTMRQLEDARAKLKAVEDRVATLQAKYDECIRKKEDLENKSQQCEGRLLRAEKLINGLSSEKGRWEATVQNLHTIINNMVGNVLASAGYIAYLGPFTVSATNMTCPHIALIQLFFVL